MTGVFADTSFFLALVSPDDNAHRAAITSADSLNRIIYTSDWILCELGNALSSSANRRTFMGLMDHVRSDVDVRVLPASRDEFNEGMDLFGRRTDKEWSLVDCISFQLMDRLAISDALTTDRHFIQAGFNALLIP